MELASDWPWMASIALFLVAAFVFRKRFARRIRTVITARGMADDDEEVTLVFKDGTTLTARWAVIKARVRGNGNYLVSPKRDWISGGIYCAISIAVPLAIGYLWPAQPGGSGQSAESVEAADPLHSEEAAQPSKPSASD
jgi:hypothetical protein